jgi:hypothetical protein
MQQTALETQARQTVADLRDKLAMLDQRKLTLEEQRDAYAV